MCLMSQRKERWHRRLHPSYQWPKIWPIYRYRTRMSTNLQHLRNKQLTPASKISILRTKTSVPPRCLTDPEVLKCQAIQVCRTIATQPRHRRWVMQAVELEAKITKQHEGYLQAFKQKLGIWVLAIGLPSIRVSNALQWQPTHQRILIQMAYRWDLVKTLTTTRLDPALLLRWGLTLQTEKQQPRQVWFWKVSQALSLRLEVWILRWVSQNKWRVTRRLVIAPKICSTPSATVQLSKYVSRVWPLVVWLVRVIGSASHLSSGPGAHAHKPRVSSSKFVSSSSQPTGGANRPASAPNKRPPSPSTSNSQNNAATGAGSSTTHNRVKYSKGKFSQLAFNVSFTCRSGTDERIA